MPELPEVEAFRRALAPGITGRKVISAAIYRAKNILSGASIFPSQVTGKTFSKPERRGKYLIFPFQEGGALLCHLRMEGRYYLLPKEEPVQKHDILSLLLSSGQRLVYRDVRTFGTIEFYPSLEMLERESALARLGPEPFEENAAEFFKKMQTRKDPIKSALLDQRLLAGIGNIYADESLFRAKIHPLTPAKSLDEKEASALLKAIQTVLSEALEEGGSTIKSFHPLPSKSGNMQNHLLVYGHVHEPCSYCGSPLSKIEVGGRGTTFCFRCQKKKEIPFVVGITGPIHAGKSTASAFFASEGYALFDADAAVTRLYQTPSVQQKLVELLGKEALRRGKVDKAFLRLCFASDPKKKKEWEKILDPLLLLEVKRQIETSPNKKVLLDVPRLFSSGLYALCDVTLLIEADASARAERLKKEGRDVEGLMAINASYPLKQIRKRVNYILENNGSKESFIKQLKQLKL